jgi:competence protein ComEC
VEITALRAPAAGAFGCRIPVYVHGARGGRAELRAAGEACELLPGERALARVQLERPRPPTNPGAPDAARRLARRGIHRIARMEAGAIARIAPAPRAVLERARRAVAERLDPSDRPTRAGSLLRALAVADASRLDARVRTAFADSGTTHLLSVSGTHVVFVAWLVRALVAAALRRTPWRRAVRGAAGAGLASGVVAGIAYAALCGLDPPALRAATMAFAAGVALLGGRPGAAWNALGFAALVVLALDPAALFEASFALSFGAVAGLLAWRPPAGAFGGIAHVSLAAGLATAPLAAAIGAPLPVGWLVANALAVPYFAGGVVPLALAAGIAGDVVPGLAWLARASAELGLRGLERGASPDLLANAGEPIALALALAGLAFGLRALASGRRATGGALVALAAVALVASLPRANADAPEPTLLALDVGHGDALLLRSGRRAWLVDAGGRFGGWDAGRAIVRPALRAEGVRRLDAVAITHADADHSGGAEGVLASLPVGELWLPREVAAAPALRGLRRLAARRGVRVRIVAAGDALADGGLELRVLWPPSALRAGASNGASLVLRAQARDACALLAGDAPAAVERALAPALAPCAVLKLAHHGSRTSSDARFLDALVPEVALASAGRRPRSPLPHRAVRARLSAANVSLFETRRDGAVRIRLTRPGPLVEPWLTRRTGD